MFNHYFDGHGFWVGAARALAICMLSAWALPVYRPPTTAHALGPLHEHMRPCEPGTRTTAALLAQDADTLGIDGAENAGLSWEGMGSCTL